MEKNKRKELKGFEEKESNKQSSEENRKSNNKDRNKVFDDTADKKYDDNISLHWRHAAKDLIVLQTLLSKLFIKHKTMGQITSRLKLHGKAHWSMISEKLKTCTSRRVQGKNFIWEKWKELWME